MAEARRIRVRDGLALNVVVHAAATGSPARPVVCLPGLTRNGRDFTEIAAALARGDAGPARTVVTIDFRGRGGSDWDKDWRNYTVPTEAQDVIDVFAALDLDAPAIIGTSRGGLVAMVVAALQPGAVGPVVFNDVGPVIDPVGLSRIAGYVGRTATPPTWDEATALVAAVSRRAFPAVPDDRWAAVARQLFNDKDGKPAPAYDPALGRTLSVKDGPPPNLWPQFLALGPRPVLVVRGALSDILGVDTMAEMVRRLPKCRSLTVEGEGHAPLLMDAPTIGAIGEFLTAS
jgi:pimeloyl-ACP methyl ester carboxylesterase